MTGQGRWVEREQGWKLHPGLPQGVRASRTRFESKGKDFHSPGNQVEGIQPPALTKGPGGGMGWGGSVSRVVGDPHDWLEGEGNTQVCVTSCAAP